MPVFLTLTDADVFDLSFWQALDVTTNSTIDMSNVDDDIQAVLTGTSITFTDADSGATVTYTDADLNSGSFSEFVEFIGNDADNEVSGSVGLNAQGYIGGRGNDVFVDSGTLGGSMDGGRGNDELIGGIGDNNLEGGRGSDILRGGSGNNNLSGGRGRDTLFAEDGSGTLDGGGGRDTIFAGENTSFVDGGSGRDELIVPRGSTVTPFSSNGGTVTLPNGNSFTYLSIENVTIACFSAGTMIRTPTGAVAVEDVCVGDMIETLDHGAQPVRWIGQRTVPGQGAFAPVCFAPGTIGNRELLRVSPQHRLLVSGPRCELLFDAPEVLCAALHLCDGDQIYRQSCEAITYVHLMFDRHELVFAEGAVTESFFLGDYLSAADAELRTELLSLFPELTGKQSVPARRVLKRYEALALRADSSAA